MLAAVSSAFCNQTWLEVVQWVKWFFRSDPKNAVLQALQQEPAFEALRWFQSVREHYTAQRRDAEGVEYLFPSFPMMSGSTMPIAIWR